MSFVDKVKIYVKAGDGGQGCLSFYFHKLSSRRIPNGGDGGRGGDIVIKTDTNLWDLTHLKFQKHHKADKGKHASSNNKKGGRGKDRVISVPLGTVVRDLESGFLIRDMTAKDESVIAANGGDGGRGNAFTKSELILHKEGEEKTLLLELKLLANIGLVGFPNAGKTTFINTLCKTRGKIAPYPFTTLEPHLGVIWHQDKPIKIADIPGLIEDAHKGRGLGDLFLKHIQRTQVLIFILGLSDTDINPKEALEKLRTELREFDPTLLEREYILIANKMDLPEAASKLKDLKKSLKTEDILSISLLDKAGLDKVETKIGSYFN
ncbi:MAG: GTPase ObgE [Candidatus Kaelpia aquatica]|nr:GTPase ObgE [Candidatus Kaelpia aquatica]